MLYTAPHDFASTVVDAAQCKRWIIYQPFPHDMYLTINKGLSHWGHYRTNMTESNSSAELIVTVC